MIILWFILVAMFYTIVPTKQYEMVCGNKVVREKWIFAILLFIPIFYMVATRSNSIGDTYAYEYLFNQLPNSFGELIQYMPQVNKDKGFAFLGGMIKIIFGNSTVVYFLVLALIQGFALIYVYRKYSTNYLVSMFLFIASSDNRSNSLDLIFSLSCLIDKLFNSTVLT